MLGRWRWCWLTAALCGVVQDAASSSGSITGECSSDFSLLSGGAGVTANPLLSLRSGNPGTVSSATFATSLSPNALITGIDFSYQYLTGYGPKGVGSNFTIEVAGVMLYESPSFTNYSYDANRSDYSPPVLMQISGLNIHVAENNTRVIIQFHNNDRNLQLLLPLAMNITCDSTSTDGCTKQTWRPPTSPITVYTGGEKDENGTLSNCFRIPALAQTGDGTLLAFAEGRYASCWPDVRNGNRIVVKWSLDKSVGKLWSKARVIAYDPTVGYNYPTPVVDLVTNTVFLFYADSHGTIWLVKSQTVGQTWTKPVNVSLFVPHFRMSMAGAGGGIQLPSGRLLFPCPSNSTGRTACFSDDHGATWQRGSSVPTGNVGNQGESSIVADGRTNSSVTMMIRVSTRNPLQNHAIATSDDGGETWSAAQLVTAMIGPTCQGSIGRDPKGPPGTVLLSAPFSHDGSLNGRENLAAWSVNVNRSGSLQANLAGRLYPCKAAYSSFSSDGTLNLFEGGDTMRYQSIFLDKLNGTT